MAAPHPNPDSKSAPATFILPIHTIRSGAEKTDQPADPKDGAAPEADEEKSQPSLSPGPDNTAASENDVALEATETQPEPSPGPHSTAASEDDVVLGANESKSEPSAETNNMATSKDNVVLETTEATPKPSAESATDSQADVIDFGEDLISFGDDATDSQPPPQATTTPAPVTSPSPPTQSTSAKQSEDGPQAGAIPTFDVSTKKTTFATINRTKATRQVSRKTLREAQSNMWDAKTNAGNFKTQFYYKERAAAVGYYMICRQNLIDLNELRPGLTERVLDEQDALEFPEEKLIDDFEVSLLDQPNNY